MAWLESRTIGPRKDKCTIICNKHNPYGFCSVQFVVHKSFPCKTFDTFWQKKVTFPSPAVTLYLYALTRQCGWRLLVPLARGVIIKFPCFNRRSVSITNTQFHLICRIMGMKFVCHPTPLSFNDLTMSVNLLKWHKNLI